MTDEITIASGAKSGRLFDPTNSIATVDKMLDRFFETARVEAVYGSPVQNGDTMVIPSAEVFSGMGFGVGTGGALGKDTADQGIAGGGGGGGGGSVIARPVAAIVITPNSVRIEPIVDVTKIALAALTAVGFMIGMMARMKGKSVPRLRNS
jgi:uncharacterized spore protein YtfJ